jgi:hypothetical protein
MFQVIKKIVPARVGTVNGRIVIDDQIKSEYKGGVTGVTVWTPEYTDMRRIELELRIRGTEVFPASFPAELYSQNQFRDAAAGTFKCSFPQLSRIEGVLTNTLDKDIEIHLIFSVE